MMSFPHRSTACLALLATVLLSACAMGHNVLKIRPPLVLSADQAGLVIEALDEALSEARTAQPRVAASEIRR